MSDETMQAAMDQAYRFLAQRFLSSYELTQKMRRKQFEDPIIERVLERLKDYDYINDERLSEQVLAYFMKEQKYGAYMIKQKMKLRGLAIPQDISAYDEVKAAYRVVEKNLDLFSMKKTPRVKVFSFLKYRGSQQAQFKLYAMIFMNKFCFLRGLGRLVKS